MKPMLSLSALLALSSLATPALARTFPIVAEGGKTIGQVELTDGSKGLLVRVKASGLTPGWHGMHFHSVATCADPGFKMSGGHVHDASVSAPLHGLLNPMESDLGDLPNLYVAADGTVNAEVFSPFVSLQGAGGRMALLDSDGSALVLHAAPDDHQSQPIGGAGARVACGAIK